MCFMAVITYGQFYSGELTQSYVVSTPFVLNVNLYTLSLSPFNPVEALVNTLWLFISVLINKSFREA